MRRTASRVCACILIGWAATAIACAPPSDGPPPILESTTAGSVTAAHDDPRVVASDALSTPASGAAEPLVIVTVFTDFQCPACPRVEAFMQMLRGFWPDEVQIHYRHFPLRNTHPLAQLAGQAVAAAHRQGGYACMSKSLYQSQDAWSGRGDDALREHVAELATACGLDAPRVVADMDDPTIADRVDGDFELGRELDVRGTPWVLVNGIRANLSPRDGIPPATLLKALVRREVREARAQLESGMTRAEIPAARLFGNLGDEHKVGRLLDL